MLQTGPYLFFYFFEPHLEIAKIWRLFCCRIQSRILNNITEKEQLKGYNSLPTLATEAHDDDGLPHTLEHLVFLGSEKYPFKGVLDLLASRCLSQGTNAWTDTDHTCYTLTTAGDEGFLKLLPIYLDHLLYPTLTDAGYVTEVHHINGLGEDAGVVYNEMQTRENSGESRCHLAMLRSMYPGHCGYKSETGGLVKNLRESTSNEKVRQYHKDFYRPENLSVIIVGQIDADKVFQALEPVEERIMKDGKREPFVRPWQTPVPPLAESVSLEVEYPTEEDDHGLLIAAWRGPLATDYSSLVSMQLLMDYFTDTSVSPLNRDLVEIDDAYCNQVDYTVIENQVSCIYLHFSNVPVDKLKDIQDKFTEILQNFVDGKEEFDMRRMETLIKKKKLHILTSMEDNAHDALASCLIGDFLYGSTLEDLQNRLQEIPIIESLFNKPAEYWINLLKTYILHGNHVIVEGRPSPALAAEMAEIEKKRIEEQQKKLGPDGLKEKAQVLKDAIEQNEILPPKEVLNSITVPSVKSIKLHPLKRICNIVETESCGLDFPIKKMPCRFQLDAINTNFIRVYVMMDTNDLPQDLRLYLPLFVELLDECPIKRNGEIIPYQDVVTELEKDTISISANLGFNYQRFFCGTYAQLICLELMVAEEKYEKSVQWIRELLYQIVFEPSRIKTSINKMVTAVSGLKRKGGTVMRTLLHNLIFHPHSNRWTSSMLRQANFLSKTLQTLESKPEEVIEKLNKIKELVVRPEKMTVHLAVNLDKLKSKVNPEQPWIEDFLPPHIQPGYKKSPIKKCHELLQLKMGDEPRGVIIGLGSVETGYLVQCAPCVTSPTHPDYVPILVLIQYLTQLEGPVWRQVRGQGLAYSCSMYLDPDSGLIFFNLTRATHIVKGYTETLKAVESHLNGECKWDKEFLESACSSMIFEIIERVKTVSDVAEESLRAYYNNVDMNFIQELLEKVPKVTFQDMERVGVKYMKPLFQDATSRCSIVCHPSKVEEITQGFAAFSRNLRILPSLDDPSVTDF
nr:uncharacterized protein C05D11.1 isoform X2 [Parasteatoda tepidariorum]